MPMQEPLFGALQKEASEVRESISHLHDGGQKAVSLGVGIFSIALPIALKFDAIEAVFALSVLLSGLAFYALNAYVEVLALGGYRRHLEEKLNEQLGVSVLTWDSHVAPTIHHKSWAARAIWVVLSFALIVSWVGAEILSFQKYGILAGAITTVALFLFSVLFVFSIRQLLTAYESGYKEAKRAFHNVSLVDDEKTNDK